MLETLNEAGAEEAQRLYQDAIEILEDIIENKRFTASGIYGFFLLAAMVTTSYWADETRQAQCKFHTFANKPKIE